MGAWDAMVCNGMEHANGEERGGGGQLEDEEAHATVNLVGEPGPGAKQSKENRTKDKKGKQRGEGGGRGRRSGYSNRICGGGGVSEEERSEGGAVEVGKHTENLAKRKRWFKQGGNRDNRNQWLAG